MNPVKEMRIKSREESIPVMRYSVLLKQIPFLLANTERIYNTQIGLVDVKMAPVSMGASVRKEICGSLGYYSLEMATRYWADPKNQRACACGGTMYRVNAIAVHYCLYAFSDWYCPFCKKREGKREGLFKHTLSNIRTICLQSRRVTPEEPVISIEEALTKLCESG